MIWLSIIKSFEIEKLKLNQINLGSTCPSLSLPMGAQALYISAY